MSFQEDIRRSLMFVSQSWVIYCHERGQWWGPSRSGYVTHLYKAGAYSFIEALDICEKANANSNTIQETMIPFALAGRDGVAPFRVPPYRGDNT